VADNPPKAGADDHDVWTLRGSRRSGHGNLSSSSVATLSPRTMPAVKCRPAINAIANFYRATAAAIAAKYQNQSYPAFPFLDVGGDVWRVTSGRTSQADA
jgi:hypothetical protein